MHGHSQLHKAEAGHGHDDCLLTADLMLQCPERMRTKELDRVQEGCIERPRCLKASTTSGLCQAAVVMSSCPEVASVRELEVMMCRGGPHCLKASIPWLCQDDARKETGNQDYACREVAHDGPVQSSPVQSSEAAFASSSSSSIPCTLIDSYAIAACLVAWFLDVSSLPAPPPLQGGLEGFEGHRRQS